MYIYTNRKVFFKLDNRLETHVYHPSKCPQRNAGIAKVFMYLLNLKQQRKPNVHTHILTYICMWKRVPYNFTIHPIIINFFK